MVPSSGGGGAMVPVSVGAPGAGPAPDSPVRVVPAWAAPPDTKVLVMLGDSASEATTSL
ncbi:MAG: hypothetical protein JNM74_01670, partial [Myxococcales bacterium]|nr:hypothetical protein [Myxococcales bacterium]